MAHFTLNKSENVLTIEERDQAANLVATYINNSASVSKSNDDLQRIEIIVPEYSNTYMKSILNAFLPAGYPQSVTDDYLEYQVYDSLQAFSSSIAGLLSSRAVLQGIGVGDSHASPTAALLLSVLQDSMGRIGTILFAHRFGTSLEPECKMYRLSADVFNDMAMLLDCLSPALPKFWRVILLSFSSVLRALCGVAAGSSKASLSAHFATQGNLGELNAKDSSQETIISLVGMLAGSLVVSHIVSPWATWMAMMFLLAVHLGMNYLAVRAVNMQTLNRQRANLAFSHCIEQISHSTTQVDHKILDIHVLSPKEVSIQERVFEWDAVLRRNGGEIIGYCELGAAFRTILSILSQGGTNGEPQKILVERLLSIFQDDDYLMWYDSSHKKFLVVLKDGAGTVTHLTAWLHALYAARLAASAEDIEMLFEVINHTNDVIKKYKSQIFERLKEAGWDIETGALEIRSGTRIRLRVD